MQVNYIQHLLGISQKFNADGRLSPLHISLYYALFQNWNAAKFLNPISICREEVMQASKIGSANTYTKCLKDLDKWGYLKYSPSFNPQQGSKIYLYTFNKTTNNATNISTNISTNKTSDKATEKGSGKTAVKALIPSINSLNNTNSINKLNVSEHSQTSNPCM